MASKRYERRLDAANLQVRAADTEPNGEPKPIVLSGYAAVFDEPTTLFADANSKVVEVIRPGAFGRAIRENQDVRALVDHNPTLLLGRTRSGTLKIWEDSKGLPFEVTLPNTQVARDLAENVRLGNASQCSFAFAPAPGGETSRTEQDGGIRVTYIELTDVDLFDVSIVTYPAYPGTTVSVEARCKAIASTNPTRSGRVSRRRNLRKAAALRLADHHLSKRGR